MKDLTTGPEGRLIWNFTVPMLIGNVFQQSYNVIDSVIVGRAIGKSALAAVGASFPILFLLVALIIGVTMGFSILISQYYGAKDMAKVRRAIDTSYIFLFFASLAATVIGMSASEPILRFLKTPQEIMPQAVTFLRIMFAGILFLFGYNSITAVLRGLGDSKTPLYFLIVSTILNVILVMLFVLVFKWGIAGSAWATVLAQSVSFIMGVVYLNRTHPVLNFRLKGLQFDRKIFRKSLAIGLPTGIQQVMVAAGMMALSRIVNGFGTDAIAAFTAAGRVDTFAVMPAMNLSAAISTFVGQNIGAGRMDRVKHGLKAALMISGVISLSTTLAIILFGWHLISMFSSDPAVIAIGTRYLFIVGGFYLVFSSMFIITGALRGAGDAFIPMLITILALWMIRIPVSVWLSARLGTDGIWWGVPIAWTVGLLLSGAYYRTGRWKRKGIVRVPLSASIDSEGEEAEWNVSKF
ncbi:MAG: MATE family efflux transporter [Elusimicrobia bacterium RIFOXYA12_FULL_51_18]|nr:MAG: MATE family efflux transporter [Elusimicrobia bacterium RIFOXYA12_FULL_51_18]OGS30056.1 MAG: MATE family efflux transporter [Elusimicrobia bacterium RIFOXYA2_FULL_53_38]